MRQTLAGATMFSVAIGVTAIGAGLSWVSHQSRDGGGANEVAARAGAPAAVNEDDEPPEIPPSQPALVGSFSPSGEIIRPAPVTARIIDPETGEEVLVPLPPGSTVVDGEVVPIGSTSTSGPGSSGTTRPGTGTTGTTTGGSSTTTTTKPTTTTTTEPTTTTTEPTTTTTEPTTTTTEAPTTTTTAPPEGLGGLLGGVADLLD